MKKISKALRGLSTLKEIKERPVGFFIDLILATILSALIPIPFVAQIIVAYKDMILWAIGSLLVLGLGCLFLLTSILVYPFTFFHSNGSSPTIGGLSGSKLLESLEGYIEAGFSDTNTPEKNPFGGNGFTNTIITMDYHDPNYQYFDGIHTGIDLVPSQTYYNNNQAYKRTGQVIVFTTMNGSAVYYIDQYGANTVDIYNNDYSIMIRYLHLATSFISTGQQVKAGQPVGVMGDTGAAEGAHLHYEVRVNQFGFFVTTDPRNYIH